MMHNRKEPGFIFKSEVEFSCKLGDMRYNKNGNIFAGLGFV